MRSRAMALAGLGILACTWLGPLPALAKTGFSAHMIMHMLIVAAAAPLLAIGIAGGRFDPVTRRPGLFSPVPASLLEFLIVWGWHTPVLHQSARESPAMLVLEQGSFLAAGLLLWFSAFGGAPRQRCARAPAGITGLLLTSMHMTLLGVLLALADRVLYAHGSLALEDQRIGGVIMLAAGGSVYLLGALWLLAELLRTGSRGETHNKGGTDVA